MINAIASLSDSASAVGVAPARTSSNVSGDEAQGRRPLPIKQPPVPSEPESAVVEISSEGARRAQAAPVRQSPLPAPLPSGPFTGSSRQVAEGTPEASETPISLPPDAPSAPAVVASRPAPASPAPVAQAVSQSSSTTQGLSKAQFEDADANQDGTVDVMERKIYDFAYPTLDGKKAASGESAADAVKRQNLAEMRAYEAVARSGRSF